MLKIKDGIDLKELEKFGFKFSPIFHSYIFANTYTYGESIKEEYISVFLDNYVLYISTADYDCELEKCKDVLYDLIQAGLVEKVGEEE